MRGFLSEWPNESSTVILETLLLSHLLRSSVLGHCLEERMQEGVIILARVDCLKTNVPYT